MNIYEELAKNMGSLKDAETEHNGMDDFLATDRQKISSLDDLFSFSRISQDTLVHKAEKDLWKISEDGGNVVIERLFDPNSNEALKV